jgi:hypothetical protein
VRRAVVRGLILGVLLGLLAAVFPARLALIGTMALALPGHVVLHEDNRNTDFWSYAELKYRLATMGWTVEERRLPENWYGKTCETPETWGPCAREDATRLIIINARLSWNDRYSTLVHEGAHTMQPYTLTKGQEEMFAMAVTAVVTRRYREPAHYLANYRADILTLFVFQAEIYEAVRRLTP